MNRDQHLLTDPAVRDALIDAAGVISSDVVLEVGSGSGFITRALAARCQRVIAVEVEEGFAKALSGLPANVEVRFGNILELLPRLRFTKVVANLPFSISEPFLKHLTKTTVEGAGLLVGKHFFGLLCSDSKWAIITPLFFDITQVQDVPKASFDPPPRVPVVLMRLAARSQALTRGEQILKEVMLQDDKLLKNALTNAIKTVLELPKKETQERALGLGIPEQLYKKRVEHLSNRQFRILASRVGSGENVGGHLPAERDDNL